MIRLQIRYIRLLITVFIVCIGLAAGVDNPQGNNPSVNHAVLMALDSMGRLSIPRTLNRLMTALRIRGISMLSTRSSTKKTNPGGLRPLESGKCGVHMNSRQVGTIFSNLDRET